MNEYFLYPSSLFVSNKPYYIKTVLGSCVSVCLWDKVLKFGGMNHHLLPFWNGQGLASPKYGNIAIEKLIKKMISYGSKKENLKSKIFGGANLFVKKNEIFKIGERNIQIAKDVLHEHKIPIVNQNVGGHYGRKIIFQTNTGTVYHKILKSNA